MTSDKTLNFHLTDRCNFKCKHCFINGAGRELTLEECKQVIDRVHEMKLFKRINIAGGEPMMVHHLQDVIDHVVSKGLKCSIITNGSLLNRDFINNNMNKLSMIGISIDSIDDAMNRMIGRRSIKDLFDLCDAIKQANIILKINICVSRYNLDHDFSLMLDRIRPDRLKILQILPAPHIANPEQFVVTDDEFRGFCIRLRHHQPVCEDNQYMRDAYWIVDSEGNLGKDNLHNGKTLIKKLL
jgi:radical S-adenosyl methionine domain-containing protein 2